MCDDRSTKVKETGFISRSDTGKDLKGSHCMDPVYYWS